MKEYKFTDEEIYLISLALAEQIINARKNINDGVDISTNESIKKRYEKVFNTIQVAKRYAKEIDNLK